MTSKTTTISILLTALAIAAVVPVCAQSDGEEAKVDPRVKAALKEIGYKYKVTSLGNCRLTFNFDDERGHLVFISSRTERFDRLETRRVWATVCKLEEPLSQEVATKLLMDNLKQKLGAFELSVTDDGGHKVSYSARVEADCSHSSLRAAIRLVLHVADEKEKELTGKDVH